MGFFITILSRSSPRFITLFAQFLTSSTFSFTITTVKLRFTALNLRIHIDLATFKTLLTTCHWIITIHKFFLTARSILGGKVLVKSFFYNKVLKKPWHLAWIVDFIANGLTWVFDTQVDRLKIHNKCTFHLPFCKSAYQMSTRVCTIPQDALVTLLNCHDIFLVFWGDTESKILDVHLLFPCDNILALI